MKKSQQMDPAVELTPTGNPLHENDGANSEQGDSDKINLIDVGVKGLNPDGPDGERHDKPKVHLDYLIETMPGNYFAASVVLLIVFIGLPMCLHLFFPGIKGKDTQSKRNIIMRIILGVLLVVGTLAWCNAVRKKLRHQHPIILMILIGQILLVDPYDAIRVYNTGNFDPNIAYKFTHRGWITDTQACGVSLQTLAIILIVDKCRYPDDFKPIGAIYNQFSNFETVKFWVTRLSWDRWAAYIITSTWAYGYFKAYRMCSKSMKDDKYEGCHVIGSAKHADPNLYIAYCCVCGFFLCGCAYFVYLLRQAYLVLEKRPYLTNRYANLVIRIFLFPCLVVLVIIIESLNFYSIYISTLYLPIFFAYTHLPPRKADAQNLVDILMTRKESNELRLESTSFSADRATRMLNRDTENEGHGALERPVFVLEDAQWALNFSSLVYKDFDNEKVLTEAGVLADEADEENGGLSEDVTCSHRKLLDKTGAKYIKHIAIRRSKIDKLHDRRTFANRVGGGDSTTSESEHGVNEIDEDAVYIVLYLVGTTLWVSFRGTTNATQMQMDVAMNQVQIVVKSLKGEASGINDRDHRHHHEHGATRAHIHDGFWTGYSAARLSMFEEICKAMRENTGIQTVAFTGHSLGGAMATIASTDFELVTRDGKILMDMDHEEQWRRASSLPDVLDDQSEHVQNGKDVIARMKWTPVAVELYTLGSPRPGDYKFFILHQSRITNSFRIIHEGDVITGTPRSDCGSWRYCNLFPTATCPRRVLRGFGVREYKHVGHSIYLSTKIKGDIVVQPNVVEGLVYLRWSRDIKNHKIDRYRLALQLAPHQCQNRVVKLKTNGEVQIVFS